MVRRPALILAGFLIFAAASCGREERAPMLAGGHEVRSWVEDLKHRDPKKRRVAVLKLGNVGDADPSASEGIALALTDTDAQVRRDAVFAVVKLKNPGEPILSRLRKMGESDKDTRARDLAKKAITQLESR